MPGRPNPFPDRASPLVRLPHPSEYVLKSLASLWLERSPLALCREAVGLQGIRDSGSQETNRLLLGSSHGLRLLYRGSPSTEPLHKASVPQDLQRLP